ncbi:glycosyltransferase [Calothrix sp. PCC 6303]|uniref:glycosyltransferase n=1 Tax=Calothrix sp. PCC 6303 TaxID=1170562 RepID=UPI0002A03993|nr:glycosyltransferase [Calothrix sp. PCC 6303]AFZ04322.1 glycosyl transferase group 1 [Calothrix sp. PCC 6303]
MKIALIVDRFPAITETFILNQITGLIRRGHQIDIYAHYLDHTDLLHSDVEKYNLLKNVRYTGEIPDNYILRLFIALAWIVKNLHKNPIAILRSLNLIKYGRFAASLRFLYSAMRFIDTPKYDVIHCQFGMHGIEGMKLREIGVVKGKLITSFRGYDISWYLQKFGTNVYQKLFIQGDFFLTNCHYFRNRIIQLGCNPNKIIIHGSGIDTHRFRFKQRYCHPNSRIKIVTVGRLIEKKGIEYAIKAIYQVIQKYSNLEYLIIGDGEEREYLEKLINQLKLNNQIRLLGWRTQQEIIKILDESHICIAPSITAKDGNQDAPVNTLKEAMLTGLPVIGTNHGGIPELIEDGVSGFIVPERNESAIASSLEYLILHPEICFTMGKAGCEFVRSHYDIEKLNDELVEIYQQQIKPTSTKKSEILEFSN